MKKRSRGERINMRSVSKLIHWSRKDDNGLRCRRWEMKLKIQSLKEDIKRLPKGEWGKYNKSKEDKEKIS